MWYYHDVMCAAGHACMYVQSCMLLFVDSWLHVFEVSPVFILDLPLLQKAALHIMHCVSTHSCKVRACYFQFINLVCFFFSSGGMSVARIHQRHLKCTRRILQRYVF